jgi:hypothetical protein
MSFSFRYLIPSVSGVMPIFYLKKLVNTKRRETLESKLAKFTNCLDNYESAIKKNKTFLHEAHLTKSSALILRRYDRDNKIPPNLVQSVKNVINALYSFVKVLETFEISEKLSLIYEPFEDLQDCDLMTMSLEDEIDLKVIKVSLLSLLLWNKKRKLDKRNKKKTRREGNCYAI